MGSNYKMKYAVDLVFVIDATGSMHGLIDIVKQNALDFYNDVTEVMNKKGKNIDTMRIKIIAYRDYADCADDAMMMTDFFDLPQNSQDFRDTINSITATGGGDDPEDGLEALAFAIRSKWNNNQGVKRRQIIVVWSDASTHKLGYGSGASTYPDGMPKDFNELTRWWGDKQSEGYVNHNAKRLILFTPDEPGWSDIANSWDNTIHYESEAGKGLEEVDYHQIIDAIANSI